MTVKIGKTGLTEIKVKKDNETVSLDKVNVIKNGVTTQVWGKRTFNLQANGEDCFQTLAENYDDAGGYEKSVSPIFVKENKIYINTKLYTVDEILAKIRYSATSDSGSWGCCSDSKTQYGVYTEERGYIIAESTPTPPFMTSIKGLYIAGIPSKAGYYTSPWDSDTIVNWMIFYEGGTGWYNPIWSSNLTRGPGISFIENVWDSTTGFITSIPEEYSEKFSSDLSIEGDYIVINPSWDIVYQNKYMLYYTAPFLNFKNKYINSNIAFDSSVIINGTLKENDYDYFYENISTLPITYDASINEGFVSARKWQNEYSYLPSSSYNNFTEDIDFVWMSYNNNDDSLLTLNYGKEVYLNIFCPSRRDGSSYTYSKYFPTGTEGTDYYKYDTGSSSSYTRNWFYIRKGPYNLENNDMFTFTKPTAIKTKGSLKLTLSDIFPEVTWNLQLNISKDNFISASYTTSLGKTGSIDLTQTSYIISNLGFEETITITAVTNEGFYYISDITNSVTYSCPQKFGNPLTDERNMKTSRRSYSISFAKGSYGSWSKTSISAYYGDLISLNGNVVTIYKYDATSTVRGTTTYTLPSDTSQYSYSATYTGLSSPIKSAETITAVVTQTIKTYDITLNSTYGHWEDSDGTTITSILSVPYGSSISTSNNILTVAGNTYTFVVNSTTTEYKYTFSEINWTPTGTTITGATTVSGIATRSYNTKTITLSSVYGSWKDSDGTTITSIENVTYGSSISVSSNILTVNEESYTFTPITNTTMYTYKFSNITRTPSESTVTTDTVVKGTALRYENPYIYIYAGEGVSSVYLSTSSTATSGTASGNRWTYGSTVYAFAVLSEGYMVPTYLNWTLVSGVANTAGAKYRVETVSNITTTQDFGTEQAIIKTFTVKLASNNGYWYIDSGCGGEDIKTSVVAKYGDECSVLGNTLSISGIKYYYKAISGYDFISITGAPSTITGNVTITGTAQALPITVLAGSYDFSDSSLRTEHTADLGGNSIFASYTSKTINMIGTVWIYYPDGKATISVTNNKLVTVATYSSRSDTTITNTYPIQYNSISKEWNIARIDAYDNGSDDYGQAYLKLDINNQGRLIASYYNDNYNLDTSTIPYKISYTSLEFKLNI